MGKKSRSISTATGSVASNNAAGSTTTRTANAAGERSSAHVEADSQHETRYRRLKRSLILMTLSCGIAMTDLLVLKEGVTVVMPDHKPLLAVGMIFGWLVRRRWRVSSKRGLHPIFRTLGFMVILAGCLAVLPFNSTVTMLEVPLFTPEECLAVAEATAEAVSRPGFSPTFFLLDPSTEVPVQDLPTEVSTMVSEALRQRLMPFVGLEFNSQGQVFLDERLYVEHYQAYHEPPPVAHVRQGQLALRVELDPPESKYVGGGGVRLESMGKTITPGMGSGLVLPAKLRDGHTIPGHVPMLQLATQQRRSNGCTIRHAMYRTALTAALGAAAWLLSLPATAAASTKAAVVPKRGCENPAAVTVVAGSGVRPENGVRVIDYDIRSKWVAKGEGESLWLELASPTVLDSAAIAFRKGNKRVHKFSIYLVTTENQAELVYEGESSGETKHFQIFSFGEKAQEAMAVTIVGYGNSKNRWNGYSEVELCTSNTPVEAPEVEMETPKTETETETETEGMNDRGLPFPTGRKGFNIANRCSFPIRVGSTGNHALCSDGTATNPASGQCFWALPDGPRDLRPGETGQYVLPALGLKEGSITWAGNIWASTGCTSELSADHDDIFPSTPKCVTNFCYADGTCPDYSGPAGITTKAEFAMVESGLDFYDVSVIDGSNIPMEIVPIDPIFHVNDHFCGTPGKTSAFGELEGCRWKFSPDNVEGLEGANLAPYTRVVWPANLDDLTPCDEDADCQDSASEKDGYGFCGIYEERSNDGASLTGSAIPGVCGKPVGWIGAQTSCGATAKDGETFPGGFPYNCDLATRHGTIKQLIRCSGSTYSKQACYLDGAEDSCCGCPPWDIENGGCVSTNPDWTNVALPWANFFKSACPTAYSFPRDDRTSMFVCSDEAADNAATIAGKNTQSYLIRFCPGDSEQSFYG